MKLSLFLLGLLLAIILSFKPNLNTLLPNTTISGGCSQFSGPNPPVVEGYKYSSGKPNLNQGEDEKKTPIQKLNKRLGVNLDTNATTNYQLVLLNVPVRTIYLNENLTDGTADNLGLRVDLKPGTLREVAGQTYLILYPREHGEIHLGKSAPKIDKLKMVDYGLLFLAHTNPNGTPKVIDGKTINSKGNYIITDVYQDQSLLTSKPLPKILIDECQGLNREAKKGDSINSTRRNPSAELVFPAQQKSSDKGQLQAEYFLFKKEIVDGSGGWDVHCKPAIYLYPQKETSVNVKVKTKGELTYTDPIYSVNGWDVIAYPDGKLEYSTTNHEPRTLNYLYYESRVPDELIEKPDRGYVVPFNELTNLYQILLPQLGLNQTQTKDFKDYWEKALPYAPIYFVGVMDQENINEFEPLEINPKPDLSIRVRLYFQALPAGRQGLDKKTTEIFSLPIIHNTSPMPPTFKLIEWGGMVKNNPLEPFTCSQ